MLLHQLAVARADGPGRPPRRARPGRRAPPPRPPGAASSCLPQASLQGAGDGVVRSSSPPGRPAPAAAARRCPRGWTAVTLKHALGQGAGLVKDHELRVGQRLQIVAALDQNALAGGAADAAEEAQGHGDDQRAGAGLTTRKVEGLLHPAASRPPSKAAGGSTRQGQRRKAPPRGCSTGQTW